jgi:lipid II:glycine glycyltransferase (peptidoglycan interpeptide bridge formation enzyme)
MNDRQWDAAVEKLGGCVFQTSAWARHKAASGWTARRLSGEGWALQALVKKIPAGFVVWSRGGPLGEPESWPADLAARLAKDLSGAVYLRICPYLAASPESAAPLARGGWKRVKKPFNRPLTFVLDLSPGLPAVENGLSENWAHNLRRGLKRCKVVKVEKPDARELAALYREMAGFKNIKVDQTEDTLRSQFEGLGRELIVWRADDEAGKTLAFRAGAVSGETGWDMLAAASPAARKVYASYALLWKVLEEAAGRGARRYDLGGADPEQSRGVFDFKKGTGAAPLEYLGEWDWARPALLRPALGWACTKAAA